MVWGWYAHRPRPPSPADRNSRILSLVQQQVTVVRSATQTRMCVSHGLDRRALERRHVCVCIRCCGTVATQCREHSPAGFCHQGAHTWRLMRWMRRRMRMRMSCLPFKSFWNGEVYFLARGKKKIPLDIAARSDPRHVSETSWLASILSTPSIPSSIPAVQPT